MTNYLQKIFTNKPNTPLFNNENNSLTHKTVGMETSRNS